MRPAANVRRPQSHPFCKQDLLPPRLDLLEPSSAESRLTAALPIDPSVVFAGLLKGTHVPIRLSEVPQSLDAISAILCLTRRYRRG
jgi:hypothetical protein